VRRVLAELNRIAGKTEAAVLIVRHLNKSTAKQAIYRGGGSIGIIGAARSGLLMTRHPEEPNGLLLTVSKSNLGLKPPGLGLRVETGWNGVGVIGWGGELEISADDALAGPSPEQEEAATELSQAEGWLREALKDSSVPAKQLFSEAEDNGISRGQLKRAKERLGVIAKKTGRFEDSHWRWDLPGREETDGDGGHSGAVPSIPSSPSGEIEGEGGMMAAQENETAANPLLPIYMHPRSRAEGDNNGDEEDEGDEETARTAARPSSPLPPVSYSVGQDGVTVAAIRMDWIGREEELYRLYPPPPGHPSHIPSSSFNPLAIDRETWDGPWCQRCQMEPVEHEADYCPNCIALARNLAHWSS
jgi:hypothetical protein